MLTLMAGDVRPTSAFLLFRRGLMEGVGDRVRRGGLGGNWAPFSLTLTGDDLFPFGLADLGSALSSIAVSPLEVVSSLRDEEKDLEDVATSVSLSVAGELCWVSLCVKTTKRLCNTHNKSRINIRCEIHKTFLLILLHVTDRTNKTLRLRTRFFFYSNKFISKDSLQTWRGFFLWLLAVVALVTGELVLSPW